MVIEKGTEGVVTRRGKFCSRDCGEPCIGERVKLVGLKNVYISDKEAACIVRFCCDNGACEHFNLSDIKWRKKFVKQYGIVNFLNNIKKEGGGVICSEVVI